MSDTDLCTHCREPVEMQRVGTLLTSSDARGNPGDDVFVWVSLLSPVGGALCRINRGGHGYHEVMGMPSKEYRTPT